MRLSLEPEAEQDLQSAFDWYGKERIGLAEQFVLAVEAALAMIVRRPESFPFVSSDVRRAPLRRFPYGVFYIIEQDEAHVIAILHAKRNPRLWMKRRGRRG